MNKLLTTIFALAVTSASAVSLAQELKGDAKAGATKNAMCIGCHGIKGYQSSFPEVYKVPMISGQSAAYISAALHEYKKGDRKHPTMRDIAASLTDQDMADLAAYYSTHGVVAGAELPAKPTKEPSAEVQALLNKANCAARPSTLHTPRLAASMPTICSWHSRLTRPTTTLSWGAPIPSWVPWPSSTPMPS